MSIETTTVEENQYVYTLTMYKPNGDLSRCSCCNDPYDSEFEVLVSKDRESIIGAMARCYEYNSDHHRRGCWDISLFIDGMIITALDTSTLHGHYDYDEFSPEDIDEYDRLQGVGNLIEAEANKRSLAIKAEKEEKARIVEVQKAEQARIAKEEASKKRAEEERQQYLRLKEKFEPTGGE